MKIITIGIIDYGMGNHASIAHSLRDLGFRVRISSEIEELDAVDVLILPGVGAFPSAMRELHNSGLVSYLQEQVRKQRPLIGICLGMQLLVSASHENEYTAGLDIIPGEIIPFDNHSVHTGWNTLECKQSNLLLAPSDGKEFYFNHSFYYQGPDEYQVVVSRHLLPFAAVIQCGKVVGLQFHPEKSQIAGKSLLKDLIMGCVHD